MTDEVQAWSTAFTRRGGARRRIGRPSASSTINGQGDAAQSTLMKPRGTLDLPKGDQHRSVVAQLWLRSRLLEVDQVSSPRKGRSIPDVYRSRGEDRPLTIANISIAFRLIGLLWADFLGLFWRDHRWRVNAFLGRRLVKGVLPAAK